MRGCLFTLVLAAAVIVAGIVFGLPALASAVITGGLTAAGLHADDTTVTVTSDPPTDLVGLRADHVEVRATRAEFRGMDIGALDLVLTGVDLVGRSAATVAGTLRDVTLPAAGTPAAEGTLPTAATGGAHLDRIILSGRAGAISAMTVIANAEAETLIADAVERTSGFRPTSVTLTAPDALRVKVGTTIRGHFLVTATGDLAVEIDEGIGAGTRLVVVKGGPDLPLRLTDVEVTSAGDLRIGAELSVGILG